MLILLLLVSYLLGSIPFGFLVTRLIKGIDIRNFGSGNIGATNVFRVVGRRWGICVFILDFLKGFIPCLCAKFLLKNPSEFAFILIAVLAICGHNWTPFLNFKGGKGIATSLGAIGALSLVFPNLWVVLALALFIWIVVFLIFRYVSLASMVSAASFFIFSLVFLQPTSIRILSFSLFIFVLIRHKKNIKRLLARSEHRL